MSYGNECSLIQPPAQKPDVSIKIKSSAGKKEGDKKSRFSGRQVKLLETIFETETKIEPLKRVQLAKELGLEPRQVAIWFQNRRARWKSKQLEKEYQILKASYEHLASQVESLKQEKQSLYIKLQNLRLALQKTEESENGGANCEFGQMLGQQVRFDKMEGNTSYEAVQNYQSMDELGDGSQASAAQEWCGAINNSHGFDHSCEAQWWEFWNCYNKIQ